MAQAARGGFVPAGLAKAPPPWHGLGMKWASALSQTTRLSQAIPELRAGLGDLQDIDLLVAFCSPHFRERGLELSELLRAEFGPKTFLGSSAVGVLAAGQEVEGGPAIALAAAHLPGVERTPFAIMGEDLPSPDAGPAAWVERLGVAPQPQPHFLILSDPATSDPSRLLEGLDYAYPGSCKIGGLASDGPSSMLFLDDKLLSGGTVGVALSGNLVLEPIVAQGCRPIGPSYRITESRHNLLVTLEGRPPTVVLEELYREVKDSEQDLLSRSLHLGVAQSGLSESEPDYLIRNVLGADPERGILAIGAPLRTGQQVRFHLRDGDAAKADLRERLERFAGAPRPQAPAGALLFACAGRGSHLFGEDDFDSRAFAEAVGVPLAGFFCAGEIGPVGESTALLGYTSSFGVFRSAE